MSMPAFVTTRPCKQCGKAFTTHREREMNQQFCCFTCKKLFEAEHGREAAHVEPMMFTCQNCGQPFGMKPSYVTAYRKKFGKDPKYCSMPCSDEGRRKDADERNKATCKNCGREFYRSRRNGSGTIYREQALCSRQCKNEWTSKHYRQTHGLPTITRRIRRGYVLLRIPAADGEPRRDVLEHRYVMEQWLGRKLLPGETVHHKDGDRSNNTLSNLELFCSNHGPGQEIHDKVKWAIEMVQRYPQFAAEAGVMLKKIDH